MEKKQLKRLRGNIKDENNHRQADIRLLWGSKAWLCMMLCFDALFCCFQNTRKLIEEKYFPNRKIERWRNIADPFGRLNKIVFQFRDCSHRKNNKISIKKALFWASDQTRWKNNRFWHEILRIFFDKILGNLRYYPLMVAKKGNKIRIAMQCASFFQNFELDINNYESSQSAKIQRLVWYCKFSFWSVSNFPQALEKWYVTEM